MALATLLFAIAAYLAPLLFVSGMPSFEGVTSWSSMNNLVPGMSHLQGLGPIAAQGEGASIPFYMSIAAPPRSPGERDRLPEQVAAALLHPPEPALALPQRVHDPPHQRPQLDQGRGPPAAARRGHGARRRPRWQVALAGHDALLRERRAGQPGPVLLVSGRERAQRPVHVPQVFRTPSRMHPVHDPQLQQQQDDPLRLQKVDRRPRRRPR